MCNQGGGSRVAWSILERLGRFDGSSNLPAPPSIIMIQEEADLILCILVDDYPVRNGVVSFLVFENPFQILILTILSAQTTDKIVNRISGPPLFQHYPPDAAPSPAPLLKTWKQSSVRPVFTIQRPKTLF